MSCLCYVTKSLGVLKVIGHNGQLFFAPSRWEIKTIGKFVFDVQSVLVVYLF